ncbi:MAG: hypothetical protein EAZ55_08945 [Cytophagales bacterium]|nr:MAG: hypothetical protein EAZ55_08945 [Cytophagales bacterium]
MYWSTKIQIDPSQATRIEYVPPTNVFEKLFNYLTAGSLNQRKEHETFMVVTILQQFNAIFEALQISNMIRLSKDKMSYYFDEEGAEEDLEEILGRVAQEEESLQEENKEEEALFSNLYMVLEHSDEVFNYLIQVNINRVHPVGEYPITLHINALLKCFEGENPTDIRASMVETLTDNETYARFLQEKRSTYISFLQQIEQAIRENIGVDDVRIESYEKIIAPRHPLKDFNQLHFWGDASLEPIYHGYFGFDKKFAQTWLWGEVCISQKISPNKCLLVNERGGVLADIDSENVDNSETSLSLLTNIEAEKYLIEQRGYFNNNEIQEEFTFAKIWHKHHEDPQRKAAEYSFLRKNLD